MKSLPVREFPSCIGQGDLLAVFLSGDGGWARLVRKVSEALASNGVSVVVLNSLRYFWKVRTPDGAAQDLDRILRHYLALWRKNRVILIGYSTGADVLPFMANRLQKDLLDKVALIALLGPGRMAEFEFHVTEWFAPFMRKSALPVLPEVKKLRGKGTFCVYGNRERASLCTVLDQSHAECLEMEGGHHFKGEYRKIALAVLERAKADRQVKKP